MLTSLECAKLQLAEYRKQYGYPEWVTLSTDKYDTQFFLHEKGDREVIICFCPSNSKIDWKNNFCFWKKAYKGMETTFRAHSGFLRCWKEVRDYIEEKVEELNPSSITVTGWSYGGALAVLCVEDMKYLYPDLPIQCVTFGAPRVISWYNWSKIRNRWDGTRQFKNGSDVVTGVPLMSMMFTHVVELTHIGQPIRIWRYFNPWRYHQITDYISTLERISK